MRKIWVVGAKGLVGKTLCSFLKEPVVTSGHEVDISDFNRTLAFARENGPITHIVNCAAFSQVDPAELHPEQAFKDNAIGPETLGRIAQQIEANLLHLSTDYVFEGIEKREMTESDIPNPCNVYGKTKWEGEKKLLTIFPQACVLRTSWIFGSGGKNFVARLIELLQTHEELKLVSNQTSKPTYAPDLCSVIVQMLDQSGLYHFANHGSTNKYDFAIALLEEAKLKGVHFCCQRIEPVSSFPSAAQRPLRTPLATDKIKPLLSTPIRHWRDCLTEYLDASLPISL